MIEAGQLFEYGIHTENSDVRAHVSGTNKTVYVFPTANGVKAVEVHEPPLRSAGQPGVVGRTAEGWLVKPEWIDDMREVKFRSWAGWDEYLSTMSTTDKGKLAVRCVIDVMRLGRFPFWIDASEDDRENVQIKGTDILVFARKRVQVKCDWRAGDTGNLFLQRAERNPLRMV
jgi:hypothetical protein